MTKNNKKNIYNSHYVLANFVSGEFRCENVRAILRIEKVFSYQKTKKKQKPNNNRNNSYATIHQKNCILQRNLCIVFSIDYFKIHLFDVKTFYFNISGSR